MKNKTLLILIALCCAPAFAQHENCNHPDAPSISDGTLGIVVEVNETSAKNIGLKLAKVEKRKIAETVSALGKIEFQPDMVSEISARISGRVEKLFVKPFDKVKKGEKLMSVQSLLPGNPPPTINVCSPRDGLVESLFALEGGLVEAGKSLGKIADVSRLYAVADVFESKLGKLKIGQKARIKFEAFPDKIFEAKLTKFGAALDSENSTLPVYFELENPDENLRFGMRGYFSIIVSEDSQKLCVPNSAIMGEFGKKFIYVQDCEKSVFIKREIALGNRDDMFVEVLSDINEDEIVVVEGNYQMQFMPAPKDYEPHSHDDEDAHPEPSLAKKIDTPKHKPSENEGCGDCEHHSHAEHTEHTEHAHSHEDGCENHEHHEATQAPHFLKDESYFHYLMLSLLAASILLNFVFMLAAFIERRKERNRS